MKNRLLELVDEYRLMIFPVVLGSGARLFPDTPDKTALNLVHTTTFATGVAVHHYQPAGSAALGDASLASLCKTG